MGEFVTNYIFMINFDILKDTDFFIPGKKCELPKSVDFM